MRGLLVGFHFCPVLLSGVALFLVAFSSSLHTDLSRDEVFERVEGNTWMFYTSKHNGFIFQRDVNVSSAMGEKSDDKDFGCLTCSLPPLPIRLCNILKIPLTGIQFSFFPLYTLLAMGSDKNNWNFLCSTLVTLRASSYSPLYDIKNQDNLLKQGEQIHTNCFMKVSKINFYSDETPLSCFSRIWANWSHHQDIIRWRNKLWIEMPSRWKLPILQQQIWC